MKCKRFAACCAVALLGTLSQSVTVCAEEEGAVWIENNFNVQVYEGTTRDYMYSVCYNDIDSEGVPLGENVYLLMVNGGFFPNAGIVLKEDRALAPAETICEFLGLEMEWNAEAQVISLYNDKISIELTIGDKQAMINGETAAMDITADLIDSVVYVPGRFVVESANAQVQYIDNINELSQAGGDSYTGHKDDYVKFIKTIVIETDSSAEAVYSVEDGLAAITQASVAKYAEVKEYLESQGGAFDKLYNKDYDPYAIEYTNFDMGRYYVYQLEGFPLYPIFYNKYTGEIFSRKAGLPSVWVEEGFINITWMYQ